VWSVEKRAEGLEYMHPKPSSHSGRILGNPYLGIISGLPVIWPEIVAHNFLRIVLQ
jgi:hypothetical protein